MVRLTSRGSGAGVTAPALSFPSIAGLRSPPRYCLKITSEIVLGTQIDLSLVHLPRFGGDVSPQPAQFLGPWTNMDHLLGDFLRTGLTSLSETDVSRSVARSPGLLVEELRGGEA